MSKNKGVKARCFLCKEFLSKNRRENVMLETETNGNCIIVLLAHSDCFKKKYPRCHKDWVAQ